VKSLQRIDPYTDYYVWVDPKYDDEGNRLPPNNWVNKLTAEVAILLCIQRSRTAETGFLLVFLFVQTNSGRIITLFHATHVISCIKYRIL
jgi:hypothetical protein